MSTALLYDGDCGFCRTCVGVLLTWDRDRRLRPVAIQSAEGARLLADLTEEQRLDSWHLVAEERRLDSRHLVAEGPRDRGAGEPSPADSAGEAPERPLATGRQPAAQRRSAGAAFPGLLRELPGGAPFAALTSRFPRATERGYRWVAGHRTPLGRAVPTRVGRWADRRIASRGQARPAASR